MSAANMVYDRSKGGNAKLVLLQLYFSNVLLKCISHKLIFDVYFSTVFVKCFSEMYFSPVFIKCTYRVYDWCKGVAKLVYCYAGDPEPASLPRLTQ